MKFLCTALWFFSLVVFDRGVLLPFCHRPVPPSERKGSNIWLWRNAHVQGKRSRGFHPRRCGSPDTINPEEILRHHRSVRGRYGGTGTVPSFIVPARLEFSRADYHIVHKNHIYSKHVMFARVTDMVLVIQNSMDISHILLIFYRENPVLKISL
jgi:hypothetical protein